MEEHTARLAAVVSWLIEEVLTDEQIGELETRMNTTGVSSHAPDLRL